MQSPIGAMTNRDFFKLYMSDTGMLCSKLAALPHEVMKDSFGSTLLARALAENHVMQQLVTHNNKIYYWRSAGKAEIEFLITDSAGNIIPIEVKKGSNVRSQSLCTYVQKNNPSYAIRISAKNFGFQNNIKSIPLYAAHLI
ncbi:MAG: DUF4143 domain-containing protein [Coriobacteriales bacterium]|nr:DUF4143 domain-containing protein [Coriobacteriales bacterium]